MQPSFVYLIQTAVHSYPLCLTPSTIVLLGSKRKDNEGAAAGVSASSSTPIAEAERISIPSEETDPS